MLLGSGELSRELALAFQRLGADVIAVDRYADAPAHGVADRAAVVKMNDAEELTALIEKENPRYVVAEAGVIAADALIAVAERGNIEVFPTPRSTRLSIDREGLRRLAADELGLPTAPFWFAGSVEELTAVAEHAGFPLVVKPIAAAPGDGQSVLLRRRRRRAGLAPRRRRGPDPAQPGDGRDRRRGRLRGHAADRAHHRTARARGAFLRADRPPPGRRRRAGVVAAAADVARRAGCGEVDRGAHRQLARRARRVRCGAAGARRRGLLRRRPARGRTTAAW